jgi:hypothetical protein
MIEMDRRLFIAGMSGLSAASLVFPAPLLAAAEATFHMWRDAGCGCCLEWARRAEAEFDRALAISDVADMAAVKRRLRVPEALRSCHTAFIEGVVVEGHVPPAEIRRLVRMQRRETVPTIGLAVPGMPAGSPGMDVGHSHKAPYSVHAFTARGTHSVFATYGA